MTDPLVQYWAVVRVDHFLEPTCRATQGKNLAQVLLSVPHCYRHRNDAEQDANRLNASHGSQEVEYLVLPVQGSPSASESPHATVLLALKGYDGRSRVTRDHIELIRIAEGSESGPKSEDLGKGVYSLRGTYWAAHRARFRERAPTA